MDIIKKNSIEISTEILNLIAEIDEFKGAWKWLSHIKPERLQTLKKVATVESIGSSTRIEGAKLTDTEVEALLSDIDIHSLNTRDEQEVAGYSLACEKIIDNFESIAFTENSIKHIHTWLLKFSDKDERHRGEYKKIPIKIEAFNSNGKHIGIIFETTSPVETPIKMHDLVQWTRQSFQEKTLHPLIIIGIFIVVFLAIHPFQDGNGRLSRLLTTLLMLKSGYSYAPYSSLESIIEANKESYYRALQRTQKSWQNHQPDWTPWLLFFLHCLQRQKIHLSHKIEREKIIAKETTQREKEILKLLKDHGGLKISELQKLTKANRNTLKKTLASMVENNEIRMEGGGRSTCYLISVCRD